MVKAAPTCLELLQPILQTLLNRGDKYHQLSFTRNDFDAYYSRKLSFFNSAEPTIGFFTPHAIYIIYYRESFGYKKNQYFSVENF